MTRSSVAASLVRPRRPAMRRAAAARQDASEYERILRDNRWLGELPAEVLQALAAQCRVRRLRSGERIAARGRPPEGLVVVLKGAVRSATYSEDGREMVFSMLRPGSVWGLVAVLDGEGAVHDTRASGDTEVLVVPAAAVQQALCAHPALHRHFARMLCYRLRKAYAVVDELRLATLRQRLARQLCTLAVAQRSAPRDERDHIRLTQDELAGMVGATRTAVNRELNVMQREGLIAVEYRRITLRDFASLRQLCATQGLFEQ